MAAIVQRTARCTSSPLIGSGQALKPRLTLPSASPSHSKLEAIRCVKRYIAREVFSLIAHRQREINRGQAAA
jgi:hypothetical protein